MSYLDTARWLTSIEDTAAATDGTWAFFIADRDMDVREVNVAVKTAIIADATDFVTITVRNATDNTLIASVATSATGFTAATFRAATITDANKRIDAGDTVTIVVTNSGGTGSPTDNITVQLEADPVL